MCEVGKPCDAGWKEPLPSGCPPTSAKDTAGEKYYRLLEHVPPENVDFQSYVARQIPTTAPECEARSISLVTSLVAAEAKKLPRTKFVGIGEMTLPPGSGALFVRKTHIHWWPCGAFDPIRHCHVVG
jgi:hypothetical protein